MADGALAADINHSCRLTGSFKLRSGQQATEYFGLELGGVPIAVALGQLTGLPAVFVRKEAKTYGTCKLAEGPDVSGRKATLIEDVITTGGAVCRAALALRKLGATVEHVVCAIDRSSTGENRLDEIGLTMHAVLTRADLDASERR